MHVGQGRAHRVLAAAAANHDQPRFDIRPGRQGSQLLAAIPLHEVHPKTGEPSLLYRTLARPAKLGRLCQLLSETLGWLFSRPYGLLHFPLSRIESPETFRRRRGGGSEPPAPSHPPPPARPRDKGQKKIGAAT
ncbi:hypothetical protein PCL_02335 [Purpureocillium lilacinum]|uniref:Uncharacterized protein n=1 Tax=Purpureocillium lilacinum TaxID=33203 RepID=A0A2U3E0B9_PURLI|nr:hypothetical protein PCL_02335 [Purpureocillium lilacinum]